MPSMIWTLGMPPGESEPCISLAWHASRTITRKILAWDMSGGSWNGKKPTTTCLATTHLETSDESGGMLMALSMLIGRKLERAPQ